ncbi:hypothetical protein [Vulcanisaeta distributa]|uniref:hypothetical protein n=1 Tax=Vulcanisaeta distributa TaxID=164451 RepID=UPI0006D291E2|nr:hypothetical protein [Vulcanisaeta distributa]
MKKATGTIKTNETLTLSPGESVISVYFFTNATVSSGQGDIYLYNSPSTAISVGYNVVPAQVGVLNATYYINGNYTVVNVYVNNVGITQSMLKGLAGTVYVNYSTYVITTLDINISSPAIKLLPRITVLAPHWALVNVTINLLAPKTCPSFSVFYNGEFYVNNTYIGGVLIPCNGEGVAWNVINVTYTGYYITLSITNTTITTRIGIVFPSINLVYYLWNMTGNGEYVIANLSIYGPYKYVVLGKEVSNSTLQVKYSLPINNTVLTINTGFNNITIQRPTPSIVLESPAISIYPQVINVVINITMPSTLTYQGVLSTFLNGSLYSSTIVYLPPGKSTLVNVLIKPMMPSIYVVNVEFGVWSSNNITVANVELYGLNVQAKPLVIIGHDEAVNITLNDYPPIELPVNLTLQGCINETMTVTANTSLSLGFDRECALLITASTYALTSEAISYWDYLNLWINNTVGYYNGYPLILNETIRAYATFLNGSEVPSTVLINGSSTFTPQTLGSSQLH